MSSFENVTENQSMAGSKIILLLLLLQSKNPQSKQTNINTFRCQMSFSFPLYLGRTVSVSDFTYCWKIKGHHKIWEVPGVLMYSNKRVEFLPSLNQFTLDNLSSLWTWSLLCPPTFRTQALLLFPFPSSDSHLHLCFYLITWYLAVFSPKSLLWSFSYILKHYLKTWAVYHILM